MNEEDMKNDYRKDSIQFMNSIPNILSQFKTLHKYKFMFYLVDEEYEGIGSKLFVAFSIEDRETNALIRGEINYISFRNRFPTIVLEIVNDLDEKDKAWIDSQIEGLKKICGFK